MTADSKALATTNGAEMQRTAQLGEMSVQALIDRKRKILQVMEAVMVKGEHYGTIPGCGDKPALFKAGAEVLATVFGLAPSFKIDERDLGNGHREYRITCTLKSIGSDVPLGEGVGSCSTMESKYRWRAGGRKCPACDKAGTIIKGKAEYGGGWLCFGKKGGCGAKFSAGDPEIESQNADRAENPDIADTYNTVLKMAKKRAQVDCTLTATGASDIFAQDLEDLPAGSRNHDAIDADFTEHREERRAEGNGRAADPRTDANNGQVRATTGTSATSKNMRGSNGTGATSSDDDSDLDIIEKTQSQKELDDLVPMISKLPDDKKARARRRWGAQREQIRHAAAMEGARS